MRTVDFRDSLGTDVQVFPRANAMGKGTQGWDIVLDYVYIGHVHTVRRQGGFEGFISYDVNDQRLGEFTETPSEAVTKLINRFQPCCGGGTYSGHQPACTSISENKPAEEPAKIEHWLLWDHANEAPTDIFVASSQEEAVEKMHLFYGDDLPEDHEERTEWFTVNIVTDSVEELRRKAEKR